jgi:methionyl-tRNA formyltransferase
MRLVFFGATKLSLACCKLIIDENLAEIVGVVTIPRKFSISYSRTQVTNFQHADLKLFAAEHDIPCFELEGKVGTIAGPMSELRPDLFLVIGWYHLIPKTLRSIAPLGCVGIHASLLPKYRGGAPLVWAMIHGETRTGVTLFHFEDGIDAGDIIAQETFEIEPEDTIAEVLKKCDRACGSVLRANLQLLADGSAARLQQDHAAATRFPPRSPEDGSIDWSWSAERIRNFIRAQTKPYPGAFTTIAGKKVTIWSADIEEAP